MSHKAERILIFAEDFSTGSREAIAGAIDRLRAEKHLLCRWESRHECSYGELRAWEPTGMIAITNGQDFDRTQLTLAAPGVLVGPAPLRADWSQVTFDQDALGRAAADHLLHRGYRRLIVVLNKDSDRQKQRADAFKRRVHDHALEQHADPSKVSETLGSVDVQYLAQFLDHGAVSAPKPLGVFATTAESGFLLCEFCRQHHIRVPEDIAIVTIGDQDGMAELARPPLSTVNVPWRQMGFEAARQLVRIIRSQAHSKPLQVMSAPIDIRVRSSTDFFAVSDPDLATALAFIRHNLHRAIAVDTVAKKASLSRRLLELRFQQHLGRTPMEFIRTLRLDQARRLLINMDYTIGQIARQCGFSSATHFGVAFRRAYGQSPSDFRNNLSASGAAM